MTIAQEPEEIELHEIWAVIGLPEETIEAEVKCIIYMDGELKNVKKVLDMKAVKEAFKKAEDGYIDDDDRFVLTDKGRELFKEMIAQ